MNRRNFLLTIPALAIGAELLIPKPRKPELWAVKMEGGYFFSYSLFETLRDRQLDKYAIEEWQPSRKIRLTPVKDGFRKFIWTDGRSVRYPIRYDTERDILGTI